MSTIDRYRYTIDADAKRIDMHTPDGGVTPIYNLSENHDKLMALAFLGVKQYINQNVTRRRAKGTENDKPSLIRMIASELQNKTAESMHQRGRPKANEGPRILKRDRIAALAAIKGVTVTALTEALSRVPEEKAEAVLNSPEVEAHLAQSGVGTEI
jgi:hypothetical protein